MKRLSILAALLRLAIAAFPQAQGKDLGPTEPDIVLPQVILEIEDLSVENVEAKLPPDEELLPSRREIPLPAEGEIPVIEPSVAIASTAGEPPAPAPAGPSIATEALVGAGLENTILGTLSVKTLGRDPRLSLSFSHEAVDGFSGHAAGSGFDSRTDNLSGELAMKLAFLDTDLQGSFNEDARGLQRQGTYIGRLSRRVDGSADFTARPLDWLTLDGKIKAGTDSLTLTGSTPLPVSEYRLAPSLGGEARFSWFRLGLSGDYSYRMADFGPAGSQEVQRVRTGLTLGFELPASMLLEGSVAWFWNTSGASLFPFELRFSGTPFGFLTFGFGAGYKVVPYDAGGVLSEYRWVLPEPLRDDSGWFADSNLKLSLAKDLILSGTLSFMSSREMLDTSDSTLAQDPATGLFLLGQRQAVRLDSDISLRWNPVENVTLGAGWKRAFIDRPAFAALDEARVEGIAMEKSGAFGGNFLVALRTGVAPILQLPVVNVGGFFKISDSVEIHLDAEDLLQPALNAPRYDLFPFQDPGFRVIAKARLAF